MSELAFVQPELPREQVDVSMPVISGRSIYVGRGGDLQAAINAAQPGDEVVLAHDATFTGSFVLPNKGETNEWITIRSDGVLPAFGQRVSPSDAGQMATLLAPGTEAALTTEAGANHYRIVGVEISTGPEVNFTYNLVTLGDGGAAQSTIESQPHHIVLDRVYIHGTEDLNFQRGIALNSADTAIVNSYISDVHAHGFDSQAIAGWNGVGPYLIQNNYLEAAGENVMFGGADPHIPGALPSDITIEGNDFYKPLSWQGEWTVKNLFELKLGDRVLVQNNHFENNWIDGQSGAAIVIKSVNQEGTAPWSMTSNVLFQHNVIKDSPAGINIAAKPEAFDAVPASNILIADNVLTNIGQNAGTTNGRMFEVYGYGGTLHNIGIVGNTAVHNVSDGSMLMFDGDPTIGFVYSGNVASTGIGVVGSGIGFDSAALRYYAPGGSFDRNTLIDGQSSAFDEYAVGNSFPAQTTFQDAHSNSGHNGGGAFLEPTMPVSQPAASAETRTISDVTHEADGTYKVAFYEGGSDIAAEVRHWSSDWTKLLDLTRYDHEGLRSELIFDLADGTHVRELFDPAHQSSPTDTLYFNADWQRVDEHGSAIEPLVLKQYDEAGRLASATTTEADGTYKVAFYEGGSDIAAEVRHWSSDWTKLLDLTRYDHEGLRSEVIFDLADGTHVRELFDPAHQSSPTDTLYFNADWQRVDEHGSAIAPPVLKQYDEAGRLASATTTEADGTYKVAFYEGGSDIAAEVRHWSSDWTKLLDLTRYDHKGLRSEVIFDLADGTHVRELFDPAHQSSPTDTLYFNADWQRVDEHGSAIAPPVLKQYDEAGKLASATTTEADGTYKVAFYEGGSDIAAEVRHWSSDWTKLLDLTRYDHEGLRSEVIFDLADGTHVKKLFDPSHQNIPEEICFYNADWTLVSNVSEKTYGDYLGDEPVHLYGTPLFLS